MTAEEIRFRLRNQYQFESFCKKVIHSERCDYLRWLLRHTEHEISFSDLPASFLERLGAAHGCPDEEYIFDICGYCVPIQNERLVESLLELSSEGRSILILSYSLGLNDKVIGQMLGIAQRQVQRLRTKYFNQLQAMMKE